MGVCLLWALVTWAGCTDDTLDGEPIFCETSDDCSVDSFCTSSEACFFASDCNGDADCNYGAACGSDGRCRHFGTSEIHTVVPTRALDILFVVDDSATMCDTHALLADELTSLVSDIANLRMDVQMAVVSTDMVDRSIGVGTFRRVPGVYDPTACTSPPDIDACSTRSSGVIRTRDYDLDDSREQSALEADLQCLLHVGNRGSEVEMGLEAMRTALSDPAQADSLLRPGARLAVVFVSDENDCSDGTVGDAPGPVYDAASIDGEDIAACEAARNLEDSCAYSIGAPGPELSLDRKVQSAYEFCVDGDRGTVEALSDDIDLSCPEAGCENQLVARTTYYDFLVELVADKNGHSDPADAAKDITVLALVPRDTGERGASIAPACGDRGAPGYRYALFARMFESHDVRAACDESTGEPMGWRSWWQDDVLIDTPIPTFCLLRRPLACDPSVPGTCGPGDVCSEFLSSDPSGAYATCRNGVIVRVLRDDTGDSEPRYEVGANDYAVDFAAQDCLQQTGSPVRITLDDAAPPGTLISVEYYAEP